MLRRQPGSELLDLTRSFLPWATFLFCLPSLSLHPCCLQENQRGQTALDVAQQSNKEVARLVQSWGGRHGSWDQISGRRRDAHTRSGPMSEARLTRFFGRR